MTPTWVSPCGTVQLWLADCLTVLPHVEADCVVTDPPYGVDKATWDTDFPPLSFWRLLASAVTSGGSVLVLAGEDSAPAKLEVMCRAFDYQWVLVWYASNAMQFGKTGFTKKSLVWWLSKGPAASRPRMPDIFEYPFAPSDFGIGHPSPKPVGAILPLIAFARFGETVLDPFMGSGTTGVACVRTGRKFIGIELEPRYFEIAVKRIEAELNRHPLFEQPQARQLELIA